MNGNVQKNHSQSATRMQRRGTAIRIWSVLCLILGVFLFVPGVLAPADLTPALVTGAFALLTGLWGLFAGAKGKPKLPAHANRRVRAAAEELLSHREMDPPLAVRICFTNEGLLMQEEDVEGQYRDCQRIAYEEISHIIETELLFLLVYGEQATILAKSELIRETTNELREALAAKVKLLR